VLRSLGYSARFYAVNNAPKVRYVPVPEPSDSKFAAEPSTYLQLLAAIRTAPSLQRLEHLLVTYGDRLDAVHVAAAVVRLPRLIKFRPEDLVDRSRDVVVPGPGLPRVRRKHGSQPRATHQELAAAIAGRIDALLPAHTSRFMPRQVACSVWAFGELQRLGVVQGMGSLPALLAAVESNDLAALRDHGHGADYAQLLQGLAKLGRPSVAEPFLAKLLPLVQSQLGSLQQRELHMVAWALAALNEATPQRMQGVADELMRTGTAFLLPASCAAVFWAFARARVSRPDLFNSLAGSIMGQAVLLAPQVCRALAGL
jgi:hypothetical protein